MREEAAAVQEHRGIGETGMESCQSQNLVLGQGRHSLKATLLAPEGSVTRHWVPVQASSHHRHRWNEEIAIIRLLLPAHAHTSALGQHKTTPKRNSTFTEPKTPLFQSPKGFTQAWALLHHLHMCSPAKIARKGGVLPNDTRTGTRLFLPPHNS